MLYMIVVLACMFCFAIYFYRDDYYWQDTILGGLLGILIGFFLCLLVILPIHCAVDDCAEKVTDKTATHEILAFADNFEFEGRVNGNIFLTSGYVDEKLKYGYMYAVEGKGYSYGSIPAEDSYINKTSNSPHIETYDVRYANSIIEWLFPCMDSDEYIVYLPEDAQITNEYIIDLK
jgi:hypothetical protein